jgi:uncharacterized surface protein with fasciclin (FAS1) repeats
MEATAQTPSVVFTHDIVETTVAAGNFTILANALRAAGLVATLKGIGPFTVFAPTDEAFRKLPKGTLNGLLKDKVRLAGLLTYHVVPGKVMAQNSSSHDVKTVQGGMVSIVRGSDGVLVNNAKVTKVDIETSNGVIHVIDTVLMPK